jgi:hypothetical protein
MDREVLGVLKALPHVHPADPGMDWFSSPDYYPVYAAVGRLLRPRTLLELGARLGYSLVALAHGSRRLTRFWWVDNESYLPGSNAACRENLEAYFRAWRPDLPPPRVRFAPSWEGLGGGEGPAGLPSWGVDLAHVDGDHSYEGKLRDLKRVWDRARVVLVDDYRLPSVGAAVREWAARQGAPYLVLDTLERGLVVFDRTPEGGVLARLAESGLPRLERAGERGGMEGDGC